jgi:hypothetical protein
MKCNPNIGGSSKAHKLSFLFPQKIKIFNSKEKQSNSFPIN